MKNIILGSEVIGSYHYSDALDKQKEKFYQTHEYSVAELAKTSRIRTKILDFERIIEEDSLMRNGLLESKEILEYVNYDPEDNIRYFDKIGYISTANYDRDIVEIHFYGVSENEALHKVMIDYLMRRSMEYELFHRDELNQDYSNRFKDGVVSPDDYYGPFFFAELSLQGFRKYYGNSIPDEIVDRFQDYLFFVTGESFKYDYKTNGFIKDVKVKAIK